VQGRRLDGAFGHIGQHRRNHRIAQALGDSRGQQPDANIVLAQKHVRSVLLGAADRHQSGGRTCGDALAQFDPAHLFELHARRVRQIRRTRATQRET